MKRESEGGSLGILIDGVPSGGGTVSACLQAGEVLIQAYRQADDPSQWDVVPRVCEYFIHELPQDGAAQHYCETVILHSIAQRRRWGLKAMRNQWQGMRKEAARLPPDDRRRIRMENDAAIKAMLALYVQPR